MGINNRLFAKNQNGPRELKGEREIGGEGLNKSSVICFPKGNSLCPYMRPYIIWVHAL